MEWEVRAVRGAPWTELEALQRDIADSVRRGEKQGCLLLSEPALTYTYGRSAKPTDLLFGETELARRGIAVAPVSRGGKWTCHGPGQILVYPIVSLRALGYESRAVHRFLSDFREGIAHFLESLGLRPERRDCPFGVYVGGLKIASFGIAIERGVVLHGVSLYLTPQTTAFQGITPCGTPGERFTSLAENGCVLAWSDAAERLTDSVKRVFNPRES